ncbi:MAG: hypothetical protein ACD_75C00191G0002, partial [uncultured bacterium]
MRVFSMVLSFLLMAVFNPCFTCRAMENGETDRIKKPVAESIRIRQNTQEQEQQWRDDKEKLLARYARLEETKKQLTLRRTALDDKVKETKSRIAAKHKQLDDIEGIGKEIAPLIDSLIKELETFVASDLPFLAEERLNRLQRLGELRGDPEVAVSEKFRKVMEALLVETEYGNTIEVYQETIALGGRGTLVDIFRLGRVGLFFQTLDRTSCGRYDVAAASWQPLPSEYNRSIATAMEIGAKRRPAELLTLPLG